ncbi:hypothetical protein OS493_023409 [Desmophyllum pertusum]|uniref:Ig-like domain-containing protein n=1 Tax=Desmophyllum pertusum TaxID=174260 RepID=A0A9W9ZZG8_9CNID|nr:hypothetical protein OS493_023409 [Desmophyllum pertusum]
MMLFKMGLKCFPWLFVFPLSAVLTERASVPVVTIFAVAGMPTVQLPCSAIHHVNPAISSRDIELMWAYAMKEKAGTTGWRMVIVKNKDGQLTETFRQPILGGNMFANTSQKNEQFYGRVNVTQPYGNLVISQVKVNDAGYFLCHYKVYKNMRSKEHGKSIVELIVEAPAQTGCNDTYPGNATAGNSNDDTDCPCTIWKTLFGVLVGFLILLGLSGVLYKLYPHYCKHEQSILLVGDGSPRSGNAYVVGNCEEETSVEDRGDNGQ